jgi:hypothetical protein
MTKTLVEKAEWLLVALPLALLIFHPRVFAVLAAVATVVAIAWLGARSWAVLLRRFRPAFVLLAVVIAVLTLMAAAYTLGEDNVRDQERERIFEMLSTHEGREMLVEELRAAGKLR